MQEFSMQEIPVCMVCNSPTIYGDICSLCSIHFSKNPETGEAEIEYDTRGR